MTDKKNDLLESIKTVLVIVLIAGGAAALLAGVKLATADAITRAELAETKKGVSLVMPQGLNVDVTKTVELKNGEKTEVYYAGLNAEGQIASIAVQTYDNTGYSGKISLLVGFTGLDSPDKLTVNRIYVLSHQETPGLGAKIGLCQEESDPEKCKGEFWTKYVSVPMNQNKLQVNKDNPEGVITAITSATISTRAVTKAVRETGLFVQTNLEDIKTKLATANAK